MGIKSGADFLGGGGGGCRGFAPLTFSSTPPRKIQKRALYINIIIELIERQFQLKGQM